MIISCMAIVRGEKINMAKISPISCAPEQYSERLGGSKVTVYPNSDSSNCRNGVRATLQEISLP
jgi:hypothetical protein